MKIGKGMILLFLSFVFTKATPLFAQDANPPLLPALVETAIQNNPELTAMRLSRAAAKERIKQSLFLDDTELVLAQLDIPSDGNLGRAHGTQIGIEQRLPYFGKRTLKQNIATKEAEMADSEYQEKVAEIIAAVKSAYYQRAFLSQTISLHREHQTLLSELLLIVKRRYAISQSSQQELLKAEIEQAKLHNETFSLEQEMHSATAALYTLLNDRENHGLLKIEPVPFQRFLQAIETLKEITRSLSPRLKKAKRLVEKNQQISLLVRKESKPDFMLGLYYENRHTEEDHWMAMGKMTLPWLRAKKYQSKNTVAQLDAEAANANYHVIENETLLEISTLFNEIKAAENQILNNKNELIPLALQALESARIGYQTGKNDFLNWIDSERTLLDLQMEQAMQQMLFQQKIATLEQIIGKEISQ
ncbi:MAG: TolC family protein [Nitrospirota bacterium]